MVNRYFFSLLFLLSFFGVFLFLTQTQKSAQLEVPEYTNIAQRQNMAKECMASAASVKSDSYDGFPVFTNSSSEVQELMGNQRGLEGVALVLNASDFTAPSPLDERPVPFKYLVFFWFPTERKVAPRNVNRIDDDMFTFSGRQPPSSQVTDVPFGCWAGNGADWTPRSAP